MSIAEIKIREIEKRIEIWLFVKNKKGCRNIPRIAHENYCSQILYHFSRGLNPLNKSQKLITNSKIAIGESNHQRLTVLEKFGDIIKITVHAKHQAEEMTPKTDNALGT